VLVLTDGTVVDESIDIMRWALDRHDPELWLDGDDAPLIAANDGPFKQHLDRYKYPQRHGEDAMAHRDAGLAMLARLDRRLAASPQLSGATRTLADMALFPFVRQFAAVDADWFVAQPLPGVQRWLAGHLASDLFARAMVRVPPWHADQAEGFSL
jgi:glutathione S-transferase